MTLADDFAYMLSKAMDTPPAEIAKDVRDFLGGLEAAIAPDWLRKLADELEKVAI